MSNVGRPKIYKEDLTPLILKIPLSLRQKLEDHAWGNRKSLNSTAINIFEKYFKGVDENASGTA